MGKVNGGLLVSQALQREGIEQIFGLIGYYVSPIFAACSKTGLKIYDTRHEQAAVHMADGYSQLTGNPGVAVVTGGPGFANTISGIIKAYKSFTPLVLITGGFEPQRKDAGGLEDMDQLTLVKQYTKWCGTVYDTARIPEYIAIAFRHAVSGRRGPVVLEIPINYLRNEVDEESVVWPEKYRTDAKIYGDNEKIEEAICLIEKAKKPIVIAGNGVFYSKAEEELKMFTEYTGIPVFTVNAGRGVLPDDHEFCFSPGRALEAGPQLYAFKNADTVIVLGSSLDYSVSFGKPPVFAQNQVFIQVDVDPSEIGFSCRNIDVGIIGHSNVVLKQMLDSMKASGKVIKDKYSSWVSELRKIRADFWSDFETDINQNSKLIHPQKLINDIQQVIPKDSIIVMDGSNAMLWACLLFKCYKPGHHVIGPSGTYGPMGTGLPLALGAKIAKPDKVVVLYTGDGSLGFNLIEVNTAVRMGIPVVIIVHNDSSWGFCRETQRTIFGDSACNYGTNLGFTRYDKIVEDFGGYGELISNPDDIVPALNRAINSNKIACLNVVIDGEMSPGANFLNGTVKVNKKT